ncbi:ATP-dependent acyl-CoA ligase [Baekduia soli]|uniref:ATP-dependent acyl-CoA ligase n=1 Tax=Baekduia soli TaxID=496014 RepID=A0A5B8U2K4_9ACTN|nr:AMP-binding protein [Baekduia soli]QEC47244.1 ATP-dependent acyl-CoA ligase [Baekduia soli]
MSVFDPGLRPDGDPRRLITSLHHWARTAEDRPFIDFAGPAGTTSLTWGAFADRVRRLAAGLLDAGLKPGDRCVLHTGNTLGFMLAFWALQEVGSTTVPTIAQYAPDELRYVVEHSGAWGVVAAPDLLDVAREAVDGVGCHLIIDGPEGDGTPTLDDLIAAGDPARAPGGGAPGDLAIIMYTSGTTSRPKGVMLGNGESAYTARSFAEHLRMQPADRVLTCMPLFHINAMMFQMMAAVLGGARFVLVPRFSASQYWGWVRDHEITIGHLINGPIRVLLGAEPRPDDREHALRVMSYGMPLDRDELLAFADRFGVSPIMIYGMTETCCGATLTPLDVGARLGHQHLGPPLQGWEVAVVDEELAPVPDGEPGEIVVRSPGVMRGYYRDPDVTAATLVDGWVRTSDVGYRDDEGQFHFVDRMKDMLKPNGENVAASEVEGVLADHEAVEECAVVGVPDPVRTDIVVALVVPVAGATVTAEELQAWCRDRLARFKVPSIVELRDELPKTSIGKIRKGELREELRRAAARAD